MMAAIATWHEQTVPLKEPRMWFTSMIWIEF